MAENCAAGSAGKKVDCKGFSVLEAYCNPRSSWGFDCKVLFYVEINLGGTQWVVVVKKRVLMISAAFELLKDLQSFVPRRDQFRKCVRNAALVDWLEDKKRDVS